MAVVETPKVFFSVFQEEWMFRQISAAIGLHAYAKNLGSATMLHTKKRPVMQIFYVKMHDFYEYYYTVKDLLIRGFERVYK